MSSSLQWKVFVSLRSLKVRSTLLCTNGTCMLRSTKPQFSRCCWLCLEGPFWSSTLWSKWILAVSLLIRNCQSQESMILMPLSLQRKWRWHTREWISRRWRNDKRGKSWNNDISSEVYKLIIITRRQEEEPYIPTFETVGDEKEETSQHEETVKEGNIWELSERSNKNNPKQDLGKIGDDLKNIEINVMNAKVELWKV